eukprot:4421424-Amphidinium_carterae.1
MDLHCFAFQTVRSDHLVFLAQLQGSLCSCCVNLVQRRCAHPFEGIGMSVSVSACVCVCAGTSSR